MAVWSYMPQDVMVETLGTDTHVTQVSAASAVTGQHTSNVIRGYRLRYTVIDTMQVASMTAFFVTQRGAFTAFDFVNPNDQQTHRVRFDSTLSVELFQAGLLQLGEVSLIAVSS